MRTDQIGITKNPNINWLKPNLLLDPDESDERQPENRAARAKQKQNKEKKYSLSRDNIFESNIN